MPIYEYRCASCGEKSTFFLRSIGAPLEPRCRHCGGRDLRRIISPVAHRVQGGPAGGDPAMDYYKDPGNVGRRVEETFKRFGVEMPDRIRKTIDEARRGKLPEGLDL